MNNKHMNSKHMNNRHRTTLIALGLSAVTLATSAFTLTNAQEAKTSESGQAPASAATPTTTTRSEQMKQELLTLSKDKWRWMAERNVDSLSALFHNEAVFVHMGATMSKTQELDTIKSGRIQYKKPRSRKPQCASLTIQPSF